MGQKTPTGDGFLLTVYRKNRNFIIMENLATIQSIVSVEKHPNADSLDIAQVLGYKCIVRRDQWKVGDKAIFIAPDSVLPALPWASFYNAKSSRVKAIKLRNEWSFGVIESAHNIGYTGPMEDGLDISEVIGVTKYAPPEPQDNSAAGVYGNGIPKTDETRWQGIRPNHLPIGEVVDVTQKIDGQSLSWLFEYNKETDKYKVSVGGRTFIFKDFAENNYTRGVARLGVSDKIEKFLREHENISLCFRGESYGVGIQKYEVNPHAKKPLGVVFYSVWNIDAMRYERKGSEFYIHNIASQLGLPTVPMLEKDVVLTYELIKKYDEELTQINGAPFEGVVIQHAKDSFKVINKHYDSKKK